MNPVKNFGEPYKNTQDDFFNLLLLLREHNEILKQCKIGHMGSDAYLSR